jgi:hypothetical protein
MGRAIVLGDLWVVDRDVGGPLVEVVDWVAPVAHHPGDQFVGLPGGASGVIDELALGCPPRLQVAGAGGGLQRDDVELSAALLALGELGFCRALVACSGDGVLVFGSELLLQPLCALSLPKKQQEQHGDDHQDHDCDHQASVHGRSFRQLKTSHGNDGLARALPSARL